MLLFNNLYGALFAVIGIVLQLIVFYTTNSNYLSLVSGITGILAVVLCAERKMSFWIFAWIQLITYLILAFQEKLWGEVIENIFYATTMIIGMHVWMNNTDKYEHNKIKAKQLKPNNLIKILLLTTFSTLILWLILKNTNDSQPFVDAISTVPAFVAQILMILAYREQWYFWLIIDVASIYMWVHAGNWCMTAQFTLWTINCIYGLKNWKKSNN